MSGRRRQIGVLFWTGITAGVAAIGIAYGTAAAFAVLSVVCLVVAALSFFDEESERKQE